MIEEPIWQVANFNKNWGQIMSVDFDPYRSWLGIPANEPRPIHYYRLCGVELFESDTEIISLNADKQLDYIRRFSQGPQSEIAERLLNEIARAKLTLLKPERRFDYDHQLRQTLVQPAPQNPVSFPSAPFQPSAPQPFVPSQQTPLPVSTQPASSRPTTTWPATQQPTAYPAPASQHRPPPLTNYVPASEAYSSPARQPGSYPPSANEAPALGGPTGPAAEQTVVLNPFAALGNAPRAPNAPPIMVKPARKSPAMMWSMLAGLVAVCIGLVALLINRHDRDDEKIATKNPAPAAERAPAVVTPAENQPKEIQKKEEKKSPSVVSNTAVTSTALLHIPNAIEKKFEHIITMQGDWNKYLHATNNVDVHHETSGIKTSYWRPTELNKEGSVVYYFPVDFHVRQGTLQTTLRTNLVSSTSPNFDKQAYLYLDVSSDGKQWHRVEALEPGKLTADRKSWDISKYLLDTKGVYVRATLFSSKVAEGGKATSQFLRAYPSTRSPVLTLTLQGLVSGPVLASNSEPAKSSVARPISIPKEPIPTYEEVVVEPPKLPTAAELLIKTENENVMKALQEWQTERESFLILKARSHAEYLRRFDEEIKQYQSNSIMKAETIKEFVDGLTADKESFAKTKRYSLAYSMLEHNQVIGTQLKEQKKLESSYETLIRRLNSADLPEKASAYEALKYHDELLQPLILCALSYKKTLTTVPEILCLCSNMTINLEPNSQWRIDSKRQLIFNRGDQPNKEYTFKIEPDGRTMQDTSLASVSSMQAYFGELPPLKKPEIKKRVLVKRPATDF